MQQKAAQKLVEIVQRYGTEISENPRQLEAVLKDYCGECPREVFLLTQPVALGLVADLVRRNPNGEPLSLVVNRFIQKLINNLGITREFAYWAAQSWVTALEIPDAGDLFREFHAAAETKIENRIVIDNSGDMAVKPLNALQNAVWQRVNEQCRKARLPARLNCNPIHQHGRMIMACNDRNLYALGLESNELTRLVAAAENSYGPPLLEAGRLYFSAGRSLFAVNTQTGAELWSFDSQATALFTKPVMINDTLVFTSGGVVYGINHVSGQEKWQFRTDYRWIWTDPVVDGSNVYFGSGEQLYSLAENGTMMWQYRMDGTIKATLGVTDSLVIAGSSTGKVYGVNKFNGRLEWSVALNGAIETCPLLAEDAVILGTRNGWLYKLQWKVGKTLWRIQADNGINTQPQLLKEWVIGGSEDGSLNAWRLADGKAQWKVKTAGPIRFAPVVLRDQLLWASEDGYLYQWNG